MDLKQQAAKEAVTLIKDNMIIGLGAGATMAYMVQYLREQHLTVQVYSSSAATAALLAQHGFAVNDIANANYLDIYFDGCDQFDKNLNALKSGGGIHTMEKLLASMAKEFVLVGDASKYAETLNTKYPVVLEVLPQAKAFVAVKLETLYRGVTLSYRKNTAGAFTLTENGNLLLDVSFTSFPEPAQLNEQLKRITGVVETSLFYALATKAITAGTDGVKIITRPVKKTGISLWQKIMLTMVAFAVAIAGFMFKLPAFFSHSDKEMHSLFYFLAAAFLNILFAKRNLLIHAFILGFLYVFGVVIEYAQQYSNTFLHQKIHGNADPEDMHANLVGLIAFSALWLCYVIAMFLWKMITKKDTASSI